MQKNDDVVIVASCRTPIGDFGGAISSLRAYELGALVIQEVLNRTHVPAGLISDVIMGDCLQCPDEANTARTAMLKAGLPVEIPAVTIQRQCSSAMQAVIFGSQQIKAGDSEVVIAGGMESMSNAPYFLMKARWGQRLGHGQLTDAIWELLHSGSALLGEPFIMGMTAENLAEKYGISREEQDTVALRSHNNAQAAIEAGRFKEEIVPVQIPQKKGDPKIFDTDEHVRFNLAMGDLSRLKPAFKKDGTVTPGNSSGLNDGASAVILMRRDKAKELGLNPMATIVGSAAAGVEPNYMGYGPVPATEKLLKKTGITLKDLQLIEVNEAFAAQYLSVEKGLNLDRTITNVNGSGIGLGHPVGSTGARIIITLMYEMARRDLSLGLATLCVGGGMGMSTIISRD
ncbi:MAG: acetyl-CoA C-acetyltransferase [Deltaproteobacteria bacterium]|nr:acetyl-CoA C-acetyltransferase [Deltaproteobacteria bacterium]